MRLAARAPLLAAVLWLVGTRCAGAGGPTVHDAAGERELAQGVLEHLSLGEDGLLRPGPTFDAIPLDAATAWSAAADAGGFWVGTGDEGVLVRVGPQGISRRVATGGRLVTAVAALPGGGCVAAVVPGGALLRVTEQGEVERLATLDAAYVWALAALQDGTVLVATGAPGALLSVTPSGTVTRLADALDDHARCLHVVRAGDYLVGTAGKGLVLRVTREGDGVAHATRVLRDLDEGEVVGLAMAGDDVLVAANEAAAGGGIDDVASLLSAMTSPSPVAPGKASPPPPSLQTGRVRRLEPDGVDAVLWQGERAGVLSMAADGRGGVFVGTGPGGRAVHADARGARILADLAEPEASVVLAGPGGIAAVVTSNPAVLHRRTDAPPAGLYTAPVFDAGTTAAWGRLTLVGRGLGDVEVRGGETAEPDATWTPWRAVEGFDGLAGGARLVARRLQVRVRLTGPEAFLRRVEAVAQAGNHAPTVGDVAVARTRGPAGAAGQREVTWRAADVDRDALASTVEARREESDRWLPVAGPGERTSVPWETAGWPDGVYEVRVTVSDEGSNPPGKGRRASAVSGPVRVDNRAPDVSDLRAAVDGAVLRISGVAADRDAGRVAAIEASVDGGPWFPLGADDGILDAPEERFHGEAPVPASGGHEVVVRATDGEGNRGSAALTVETP